MHERVKSQSECTKAASKSDEPDLIFKGNTIVRVSGRCFPSVAVALAKELLWLKIQKIQLEA